MILSRTQLLYAAFRISATDFRFRFLLRAWALVTTGNSELVIFMKGTLHSTNTAFPGRQCESEGKS